MTYILKAVALTFFVVHQIGVSNSKAINSDESLLSPVQHVRKENGIYIADKDIQLGDPDDVPDDEPKVEKVACIPRETTKTTGDNSSEEGQESNETELEDVTTVFNDTTVYNGTDVNEVMELRVYRPLCDD